MDIQASRAPGERASPRPPSLAELGKTCMVQKRFGIQSSWLGGGTLNELAMELYQTWLEGCVYDQGNCAEISTRFVPSGATVTEDRNISSLRRRLRDLVDWAHRDPSFRRAAVRVAAKTARSCRVAGGAMLLANALDDAIRTYRKLSEAPEMSACRMVPSCNPRDAPKWALWEAYCNQPEHIEGSGYDVETCPCYVGCEAGLEKAFQSKIATASPKGNQKLLPLARFVHRRVTQGVSLEELEELLALLRGELGAKRIRDEDPGLAGPSVITPPERDAPAGTTFDVRVANPILTTDDVFVRWTEGGVPRVAHVVHDPYLGDVMAGADAGALDGLAVDRTAEGGVSVAIDFKAERRPDADSIRVDYTGAPW